ncbi:Na+ H+ exchanger 1 [Mycena indigotica]|uniref:Na+ H+ exchanger 1 n=1 Tax=Mycena indigotica TaxID=2126181 RepID=A0A8H6SUE9_9AGAR|nr:Na+ H+ exchanger 1 [Mycena indigotica]KAF7304120.1 Na+ H+ exchanger 1 [Mycena indigotica]
MAFDPLEISTVHIAYAVLGGFVVLFGMFSLLLREKLYVGEAIWAFLFGVAIGPYGADVFNPRAWANGNHATTNLITLEFTRVVLAIGVFAIGVELPKAYMRRHWQSLFFLLGPVMIWGWFVSAGFIYALTPGLTFLSSLAVAACLTPTDPILAAAIIGGKYADKHVPAHIRHLLAAESGCNDGAAFPFLYIALYLLLDRTPREAVKDWFLKLWLYQVLLGILIGALLGFGFRYLMRFSERHGLIDRHSYVAQYVSLALLTIGLTTLLGSDDLLSAFSCGAAFAWDGFFNRQTEESVFSSVIDLLFNVACFVYIGAWMPFAQFNGGEGTTLQVWRLVIIAILTLLFRRLPVMLACYRWIPDIKTFREAVFAGHFGPMGVGAVFIATLASEVLEKSHQAEHDHEVEFLLKTIQPICAFMVLWSIAVHGLSIPGFSLGRRVHSVSRTWSRHTTATATVNGQGAGPDWMTHVRRVESGVVVNRDPAARLDEEKRDLEAALDKRELEEITAKNSSAESKSRSGETPPDGETVLAEWQEGHHRVIERRAGPGEEVKVEVLRNTSLDGSSDGPSTRQRLVENLKYGPKALGDLVEERLRESPLPGFLSQRKDTENGTENGNDDGWASEDSTSGSSRRKKPRSVRLARPPNRRRASGGGRKTVSSHVHVHRAGLAISTAPPPLVRPATSPGPAPAEPLVSEPASPAFAKRTGRRSRVDSLRATASNSAVVSRRQSREASPARSVRFAGAAHEGAGSAPMSPVEPRAEAS